MLVKSGRTGQVRTCEVKMGQKKDHIIFERSLTVKPAQYGIYIAQYSLIIVKLTKKPLRHVVIYKKVICFWVKSTRSHLRLPTLCTAIPRDGKDPQPNLYKKFRQYLNIHLCAY